MVATHRVPYIMFAGIGTADAISPLQIVNQGMGPSSTSSAVPGHPSTLLQLLGQEPVKKADRKVRPPGDVLLVTITMLNIAVLLISDSKRREVRWFVSVTVRAQKG